MGATFGSLGMAGIRPMPTMQITEMNYSTFIRLAGRRVLVMNQSILSFVRNRHVWFFATCLLFFTACQSVETVESTEPTPITQHDATTQPNTSLTALLENTVTTTLVSTTVSSGTPTLTPSPTLNNIATPTLTPTTSYLQKIEESALNLPGFPIAINGTLLATLKDHHTLYVFDTPNWDVKQEIENQAGGVVNYSSLDFSPDGKLLATGGINEDVRIWDITTGELIHAFVVPYHTVDNVSFSPDGSLLVASSMDTISSDYGIMIWSTASGQLVNQFPSNEYGWYVIDVIFVPDHGNLLAIAAANLNASEELEEGQKMGGLYFWDIDNQQLQEGIIGTFGLVAATSPNGQLVAAYIDDSLRVWNTQDETEILNIEVGETADTKDLALTNTGLIANLDTEGKLTIWNLQGELLAALETDETRYDIAFAPNGDLLIVSYVDNNGSLVETWKVSE